MTIEIKNCPPVVANLIPMHVQYTGVANTKEYFTNSKSYSTNTEGYFRGLKLVGKPVDITGRAYLLDNKDEGYTSVAQFDQFTIYGHDSLEAENQWELVNEWIEVGDILHD